MVSHNNISCPVSSSQKICISEYLGVIPYQPALRLQERLARARAEGSTPDTLLLLQHPPVITIGRFRGEENIIVPRDILRQKGIEVFYTNRGGSVTYHGPGQLVGYPIINLRENRFAVRDYLWRVEEVIIRLLYTLGIQGYRRPEYLGGVWVGEKKVCSIGIRVNHHVTMHGFALNVSNDLAPFEYIHPCGIKGKIMTSLSKILDKQIEVEAILEDLLHAFSAVFELECEGGLENVKL